MTKYILFLSFIFAQASAWAQPTILGKWERQFKVDQEITLSMKLNVRENQSTFDMTCNVRGQTGDVVVTIPTKVDGWNFHILEQGVDAKDVDDFDCRLVIHQGIWTYDLAGDDLKLVTDQGGLIFMKRSNSKN